MNEEFLRLVGTAFPVLASKLGDGTKFDLEQVEPPAPPENLLELEKSLGVPLPESYKSLLRCGREFWLCGGMVQFGFTHPFFHNFRPLEQLMPRQQAMIRRKGGGWPPPSQGMLCFAEFFWEADGDQVLFDVSGGLVNGEYPVLYYAHEAYPPEVRRLTSTFTEFINDFLDYPGIRKEGAEDE